MKKKNRLLSISLFSILLTSCSFDLGVFEKEGDSYQSYYDTFGEVVGIVKEDEKYNYNVKNSLFNDTTVKSYSWEKSEYEVKEKDYVYISIPIKEVLKIESVALYVKSTNTINMEITSFYFPTSASIPQKIKFKDSPDMSEDDPPVPIQYDDPAKELSLCNETIPLTEGTWTYFILEDFAQEGYEDKYLHTAKNSYLYIRVENNSGLNKLMPSVTFTFLNLLIRAID